MTTQLRRPPRAGRGLRPALGVLACALVAVVYQRSLDNPFVFDDRHTVLLNPSLIDPLSLHAILFYNPFRPIVNLSYAFDHLFSGISPFGFHITSGILHLVAVALFYGWCTRALTDRLGSDQGQTGVRPGSDRGQTSQNLHRPKVNRGIGRGSDPGLTPVWAPDWAAFFAAAVFGLHPLMTEGAGYVTGRSEELCAIGFLGGLIMARRAILASSQWAAVLAVFAGLVAIGSNAGAIALPAVVLAYDAWVLRSDGYRRRLWRVYLPATAILAIVGLLRLGSPGLRDRLATQGSLDTFLTESIVVWRYLALLLVPAGQTVVHHVRFVTHALDLIAWPAAAGLIALGGAAIGVRRTAPLVAVGAVWFFGTLAPSSTVVPLRDAMAEHRLYLPALGVLLAIASVLAPPLASRRLLRFSGAALLTMLALLTYQRTRIWSDPLRLWAEAVQRSPDMPQAHVEYADELRDAGHCDRAVPEYQAALRLDPGDLLAQEGWGECSRK